MPSKGRANLQLMAVQTLVPIPIIRALDAIRKDALAHNREWADIEINKPTQKWFINHDLAVKCIHPSEFYSENPSRWVYRLTNKGLKALALYDAGSPPYITEYVPKLTGKMMQNGSKKHPWSHVDLRLQGKHGSRSNKSNVGSS